MQQVELLRLAIETLERLGITYMVVGSYASGSYGEPRFTNDIDIVVDLPPALVAPLCAAFAGPEFYVSEDGIRSAIRHRSQFNVIHADSSQKIDFMIPKDEPYFREQLARRQRVQLVPGQEAFSARPEDVIMGKMIFYKEGGSEKHLRDMAGILRVSGLEIDHAYVERWARILDLMDIWQAVVEREKNAP